METWKDIPGYEGAYQVSDQGRVRSLTRTATSGKTVVGTILKLEEQWSGYRYATLWYGGRKRKLKVAVLVLTAFVGPRPKGMHALHGVPVRSDDRLVNLRWGTHSENMQDKVRDGNHYEANKTECVHGHAYTPENTYLRPDGKGRQCRACILRRSEEAAQRRGRHPRVYTLKSHCKYGHALSGDNLYVSPQGKRACNPCRQRRTREWQASRKRAET